MKKFDTVLIIKGDNKRIEKGFFLNSFQGKYLSYPDCKSVCFFDIIGKKIKKVYGKKYIIRIYSTRMVLTEKYITVNRNIWF